MGFREVECADRGRVRVLVVPTLRESMQRRDGAYRRRGETRRARRSAGRSAGREGDGRRRGCDATRSRASTRVRRVRSTRPYSRSPALLAFASRSALCAAHPSRPERGVRLEPPRSHDVVPSGVDSAPKLGRGRLSSSADGAAPLPDLPDVRPPRGRPLALVDPDARPHLPPDEVVVELGRVSAHRLEAAPLARVRERRLAEVRRRRPGPARPGGEKVAGHSPRHLLEVLLHVLEAHDERLRLVPPIPPPEEVVPALAAVRRAGEDGVREGFARDGAVGDAHVRREEW